ncbi:MAG TPA: hypothetical protein VMM13_17060 [Euzebya sp.]|nr:hypothetical protein [Euzebya sp.]
MHLITPRTTGRQLMVLDDAETIARQARRQLAMHRRRRERLHQAAAAGIVPSVAALIMGVSLAIVTLTLLLVVVALVVAAQQVRGRQQMLRRQQVRATPGPGIGTPRPKGGFSTTRHRSGAPVWIRDPSAGNRAA